MAIKKPTSTDPLSKKIKCECGAKNCKMGLTIGKYPGDKIKLQIFDKEGVKTMIINKKKLLRLLK